MAAGDWVFDLIQESVYEGTGRNRKVSFPKLLTLLRFNGAAETAQKLENDLESTAGRKMMTASNALRGAARRQKGLNVVGGDHEKRFVDAPPEWLAHYRIS